MKRVLICILCILMAGGCVQRVPVVQEPVQTESTPTQTPAAAPAVVELVVTVGPTATPVPTPTATPEPTPTPSPEPTPTPTPSPDPNRLMVALTFDDGPNNHYTMQFLDVLEKYGVRATFFVLASAIHEDNWDILKRMASLGCEIGAHGQNHEMMTGFNATENAKRLERTRQEIDEAVGGYETHLMRPPGGNRNNNVLRGAKTAEMAVVLWSVDSADWKVRNRTKILDTVKTKIENGSIVLFHDRIQQTLEAIDELIPWLLDQGYELVTVSELLQRDGSEIEYGEVYRKKTVE